MEVRSIGLVRTPFRERAEAPRQPSAAAGTPGRIELATGLEDAVADLERWERIWVLFWFHLAKGFHPKVLPPRSARRRGVLATRSPHRPNPIGLSALRLVRVEGLVLHVLDVDMVDGTPVLDVKPYLPWCDAAPSAGAGWLEDPGPTYDVEFDPRADEQLRWLEEDHRVELRERLRTALAAGPEPHAYRRIKREGELLRIAVKEWRARFRVDGRRIVVLDLVSGYRPRERDAVHQAFVARYSSTSST